MKRRARQPKTISEHWFEKESLIFALKEINESQKEISLIERYCTIAVAAVYAWLFSRPLTGYLLRVSFFIPSFIIVLSWAKVSSLEKYIKSMSSYYKNIEKKHTKTNTQFTIIVHPQAKSDATKENFSYNFFIILVILSLAIAALANYEMINFLYNYIFHLISPSPPGIHL